MLFQRELRSEVKIDVALIYVLAALRHDDLSNVRLMSDPQGCDNCRYTTPVDSSHRGTVLTWSNEINTQTPRRLDAGRAALQPRRQPVLGASV